LQGFNSNDFYDLARGVGGDLIEQAKLIDVFTHPKTKRTSHCYRIVYRHMSRVLLQDEVNQVHDEISVKAEDQLLVEVRRK
jgi:phenylalanyl-tRNA synthetase alpha chain